MSNLYYRPLNGGEWFRQVPDDSPRLCLTYERLAELLRDAWRAGWYTPLYERDAWIAGRLAEYEGMKGEDA